MIATRQARSQRVFTPFYFGGRMVTTMEKKIKREWTCAHFNEIAEAIRSGKSQPQISEQFNVTIWTVHRVSELIGGAPRKYGNQHTGLYLSREEYEAAQQTKRDALNENRKAREATRQSARSNRLRDQAARTYKRAFDLWNKGKQLELHFCKSCGAPIARWNGQPICPECSRNKTKRMSNAKKERRRRAAFTPESWTISLDKLYERDGGMCWICGEPCDYETDRNGDLYPSIDHIVPISKGGKDTWDNIRLAHRICNSLRQNGPPLF